MMGDNVIEGFRVSPQQKNTWLLQQYDGSLAYRAQCSIALGGKLNAQILRQAVEGIVDRHEILRTTFYLPAGMTVPFQVINGSHSLSWRTIDLTHLNPTEQQLEVEQLFEEDGLLGFDLQRGPLLRLSLLTLSNSDHVLLLSLPSLCADGSTLYNLIAEISRSYAKIITGEVTAAEVQSYIQFSEWQNELLMEPAGEAGRDHWRKQHVSSIPEIRLPFERKPVESSRFAPAALAFEVRPDVTSKMVDVVEKYGASVPGFLLTCWQVLLWRLVRQPDIVVGVVLDGRSFPELQYATGLFARTLPVRCHFHDDSKFSEVLSQMDVAMRSAADWQDYFIAEQSEGVSKNRLESAIFPISFEFFEEASSRFDAEVSFSVLKQYVCIDRFNIELSCVRRDNALTATLNYDPYLFSPDDIRRLAGEFPALLESAVKNPHASISELEVLSEAERQQLLFDFNNTRAGEIANSCFHELFQQQVGRTPNEVAVVCENEQLTYAELNLRANQLAHHLSGLGVGPEVPVALQVERSLEMIVGLVAILKAGGAYVPLDPALPKERLAAILEDSQTSIILTQRSLVENLPERQMRIICLDTDRHLIAQERRENPLVKTTLSDLAYIIFTSGSTGRPKGVAVEHGQLLHYLNGILNRLDLAAGSSFATVSTLAADLGNTAIFPALCTGGCLHIVTQERASDPDALAEYFRLHRIDCLKIVPSHLEALLFATHPENILSLQRLVLGGEPCSWALIDKIQALSPNCSILNHYGPTETTIGVTTYAVANEFPGDRPAKPPIGRPIANSQTYVLDRHMQPVPIGVPGELYISGNGLARGYYNHPELTAEKFIPHPFSDEHGARLYKTGDRARYLPDGNIEFLGRTDSQIKLRGYRIEPGEIEAALREHPDIREGVVEVREDESEDKRLIGYVVAVPGSALSTNELRSVLQEKLPEYMIPFSFVFLDALPLTPNGKLDRKALPEAAAPQSAEAFAAPRTQTEELLASIWAVVLKIDKLGIHDNFFELGGHSLLAMRLISRIRDTFRLELPLRSLFETPTVAGLAELIGSLRAGESRIRDLPIVADPSDEEYPLTFSQERFWFLSQLEPNNLAYKATRGFRLSGPLNIDALEKALWEIVRRHEILRTTYQLSNGYPVQRILDRWFFRLSIVDLTQISRVDLDAEVQRLFENAHRSLFDLSTDVLLRATLVRLSADENVLLVDIHHVAWDHWCIQLFLGELSILYQEFTKGNPSPLTDLPIQYKHYALWQRKIFQGAELESQLAYWKEQLADAPPFLELPTDHPRKPLHDRRGGRQVILLPSDLSSALRSLSRNANVTFFMTLLAAFQTLLHRLTGDDDIVVGTPVAGRNRSETEGLLGLFLNSLVLRTSLSGNPTFLELLARVREVALGAYDHQELPFEKLVEELQPERDLSRTPIFQVFINLYNFKEAGLEIDGLTVRPLKRLGKAEQQFDLEFYIREHGDGTHLIFGYDLDLFETSTIARMLSRFQTLLEGIVADPEQRITELPFLSEVEKHQLLVELNETKRDYPTDKYVHQLFEEQANRTPEAVAVVFQEKHLTYRELNTRANQLAHYLKRQGVGPETLVGICVERSLEMIVGLLGILKAGGAYVPLDPGYPKERLAFMLEDARIGVLLTQQGVLEGLPQPRGRVVYLDGDWGEIAKESEENPEDEISGENLAYVIYTSGSTGNPKGVAVEHRQVLNYMLSILDRIELPRPQSFATVSTLAADLGNTVIFSSLCTGAALHVISRDRIADAEAMAEYFSRHAIECLKIVPSHLAALQTTVHPEKVLPRKLLILGGEAAPFPWVKSLQKQAPGCAILNHYGPTETTIGAATYRVEREPLSREMSVLPLGRPLSNTETYILDPYLNPVPIGVVGELYIGGRNLTRGYLHGPDLTASKFVAHPFSDEPGARLYKTGDRARYRADGNIEFLGRVDHQVKIRGYRIEPGEIEVALREHPDIRESVVEVREDASGDKRLIAYVVARPDRAPTVGGKPRYRLPNGAAVVQLNKNETDYIYQEIFERQAYLRHGITIKDGDCIFDVGANIGLFTLFAHQIAKHPRVYSFEPNPAVYEIFQANAELYGSEVRVFNCGLSNEAKRTPFTFFPGFSLLSGFYADAQADKEVVKTFMTNQRNGGIAEMAELVEQADGILAERFTPETFDAELRTLSDVIEQERIERIDLLKINVEKSELDVLAGIEERHWARIRQIVLEVDVKEHLPIITALLERRGYEYAVEQDDLLEGTSLCYLYAIRADADTVLLREQPHGAHVQPLRAVNATVLSSADLRAFLSAKLPEYMVPATFVFLDGLPLTLNGKLDRKALPEPVEPQSAEAFAAPRTQTEELLASIWADVLKIDKLGIHDNFFELGGHSLLAARLISRIRDSFRLELPLRSLFEAPTVAGLAERLGSARAGETRIRDLPIVAGPSDEQYPLSFSQERFWFLSQLDPNNPAYKVTRGFRFSGPLNIDALEKTLWELVQRHETLRATFHESGVELVQKISECWSIRLSLIDLMNEIGVNREQEIQRLFESEQCRSFDLCADVLLRPVLVRLSAEEHVLVLSSHHISWDHWSLQIFFNELSVLYRQIANAQPLSLPSLPIQYKHYALWQRKMFQGPDLESHLSYWKKQLAGAPPFLELPTDHPRKPLHDRRGGRQVMLLPSDLSSALRSLSRNANVTFFMTLLAAFQTLLHRLTGEEDIVVGTPVAGRNRSETEGLLGLFLNSLALRTSLSGNPTFLELLRRVREVALGAYDHQELPFEKLVEELQPKRDLSRTPIFQVFINMYNFKEAGLEIDGLTVRPLKIPVEAAPQFDLEFYIREHSDSTQLTFTYDADLFEAATIERMLGHFQTLLEGIVANPEQRISDLPILSEGEKHRLFVDWNDTKREYPNDKCIHQLFEEQVKRTPEAVAVVFQEKQLTYRDLNTRANQLAHYLKRLGVGPETLVGICVERSLEMIVGLFGILKAGGAYVPLDPSYPQERISFMLDDSRVMILLTQQELAVQLFENDTLKAGYAPERRKVDADKKVTCLDRDWEEIARENEDNPANDVTKGNLAYLIYTSGSTGKPKGVLIQHGGVVNFLASMAREPGLSESDILLAVTTLSFDIAGLEIYLPLTMGARVVLACREIAADGIRLAKLLSESGTTVMQATPTTWRMLLAGGWQGSPELKILCGGEPLSEDLAKALGQRCGSVWNMYGPTETTIWSATQGVSANVRRVTLGRPIANTQTYVLDKFLSPVPIGVPGELHIGGDGLARGYLNRPELTAEKFIPNPFSDFSNSRLYRTGDLARYQPDGSIEFLGRIDHQIKLRGYRIELGEIEAVLNQHIHVRESIVVTREDAPGDKRLVAYVRADDELNVEELRSRLSAALPDYMVPSAFVRLRSFPLNSNGKIDRTALPPPGQSRPELGRSYVGPRTEIEATLCEIFGAVLRIDKIGIGIHDNFFELGGHSLLATQVIARIRNALSVELPLRRLFECPTINGLAKIISTERQPPQKRRLGVIVPASRDRDLPLSFAQQRLWFIDQLEPESSAYNVPRAWRLSGPLNLMALKRSVNEIVRRHEVLRTSFVTVDGQPLQRIRPSATLSLDLIRLEDIADREKESAIKLHVRKEFREPFDLARGPLLRVKLLRLAEDDHVLLLTMHHIVSDGWSAGVLFREISRLYEAYAGGAVSPLEDLPTQYADYAVWQRGWLQGEVLESQLAYWRKQLENLTVLHLPTDRPRPPVQRYRGARARVQIDASLTKRLWALSRGENATPYITLLAAFQILLSRYSGQEDIAVGSPIAFRSTPELERLIGFFANTLVLRGDLSNNPTFREFLRGVRNVALEAYAHQDLPFEKLVEELRPRRDLNISPLFQVMLAMENNPREDLDLKGLKAASVSIDGETAKFDLLLSLRESEFGLRGTLEYDVDLFDSTTIDRMLAQFETLLRGIVANPDQRLLQLPLLTDGERHQLLSEWNETAREYPKHLCVHQLFEKQAETHPEKIAIVFEDRQMTYRELDIGSNQLAHYLRKQGVGAESVVGVCLERSPEMILAMLAVLKAGGAYLPLDPSYPTERLALMVEQAGALIILTQKSLLSVSSAGKGACHYLDNIVQVLTEEKQESLGNTSSPENAAYVLFTSGSTGVPKGVLMEHRPLVNLLSWQAEAYASFPTARTLQFAPLSFDVSFQEIFSTLCFGGTLVMVGEAERRDAKALWPLLKEKAVERIFLPFIALQQLAEAAQDDAVSIENLREIITAGEQLQVTQPIADLFARLPDCRLYNQYGPTESHVVTSFALGGDPADWPSLPPIGRPVANSKVYILDRCLQPVPVGVIGELYIGGDGLARGYVQPGLSREKFISNPFIKEPGARLYRSGDLARYLTDGNIQFVGRIDDQIKIRGFRVEPGEIETLLSRHPEVLESVVSAREDASGGKWLVAYIVAGTAHDLNSGKLRDYLKEKLPEYMIPNVFMFLDSLPLTASGKVDRRRLPAPDGRGPDLAKAYSAPRNQTEELLTKIWAEVLKLDRIGIHDNFFDLGGHSLLATRVVSGIRKIFHRELPLRALFETPTVAGLSKHIEATRCEGDPNQRAIPGAAEQTEETIL